MPNVSAADLNHINSFPALVEVLRDRLDWPIGEDYGFDDLTYDYDANEFGLKPAETAKIREIHQLRPLVTKQPWGIFFISFEDKNISVTVLRRILRRLVVKKRAGVQSADQQTWRLHDLIFVANFGRSGERELAFAHFSDGEQTRDLPVLKVLGWNAKDTKLHNDYVASVLNNRLIWPDDPEDQDEWRKRWQKAFEIGHGEVIRTSKDLAVRLAALATDIRARANQLLGAESEDGPMRTLLEAFRKNLIHDLDQDGFADMFAQTIAYGLLAARISRESGGLVADNLTDMVPPTNPFLKELFETFLSLGGRDKRKAMDFDELGVRDVVDLLARANMEAVLADFGDRNPKEDPVIHFYELFLKEYDPKKRMQRGVFYTPRPVVNFIVRGVDEVLSTDFGLPLGLADTTTWAELAAQNAAIVIPDHVDPETPFVQILDPAIGTGTFLVEVIDLIHKRMRFHWKHLGKSGNEIQQAWNDYVEQDLLPRLNGFELMMAPYAIAHMKIGLKLYETGYRFGSNARARIYLTNSLEPPGDVDMEFTFMSEALAHETQAVNEAKKNTAFTVIIGNPPYSVSSSNKGKWITELCEVYKEKVRLEESQIQSLSNDYIKFIRFSQYEIENSNLGVVSLITGHGYLLGTQPRDLRRSLSNTFSDICGIDLNGSIRRDTTDGDDEPVFEIITGVAISLLSKKPSGNKKTVARYVSIKGRLENKFDWLMKESLRTLNINYEYVNPGPPNYFFWRSGDSVDEFENYKQFPLFFGTGDRIKDKEKYWSTGFTSQQDQFAIAFEPSQFDKRMDNLAKSSSRKSLRQTYNMCTTNQWDYTAAKNFAKSSHWKSKIAKIHYRPFDYRYTILDKRVLTILREQVQVALDQPNLAITVSRAVNDKLFAHTMIVDRRVDRTSLSSSTSTNAYVFPLWLAINSSDPARRPNICRATANELGELIGLNYEDGASRGLQHNFGQEYRILEAEQKSLLDQPWDGCGDLEKKFGPHDIFDWIYAVLHSPNYRERYAEFLKSDFPRIPFPKTRAAFADLISLGHKLVAVHLLRFDEELILDNPDYRFAGSGEARVEKGYPKFDNGKVMISDHHWFEDVPIETWEFHVGGYQVLHKWLKDRAGKGGKNSSPGRVLDEDDILHYRRVITALTETRRLMTEIDQVIDRHGGWPDAFYVPPPPPPSIEEIIEADESRELEFKSTFLWDVKEKRRNPALQKATLKTLAAFLNSNGGTLVIGVTDGKEICGLEKDLEFTKGTTDQFERTVRQAFDKAIGVDFSGYVSLRFAEAPEGKQVCIIDVEAAPEPAFLKASNPEEFYIRRGNASVPLSPKEQHDYIRKRFQLN